MNEPLLPIVIDAVIVKDAFFIREYQGEEYRRYDGERSKPCWADKWKRLPKKPEKVTVVKGVPDKIIGYRLKDATAFREKFPETDAAVPNTTQGYGYMMATEALRPVEHLYDLVREPQPDLYIEQPVEWNVLLEMPDVSIDPKIAYPIVTREPWEGEKAKVITIGQVKNALPDLLIFPTPYLPARPCILTSKQVFDIVRQHVKTHIDLTAAQITSDYDFCFTVKRIVMLTEPITENFHQLFGTKRQRAKVFTKTRAHRDIEVFQMTWSPECYKGYTPIEAMVGQNADDLKAKMDGFLDKLMTDINTRLKDCPSCKGYGVVNANGESI